MRTHNIPSCLGNRKYIPTMPPDLARGFTIISSKCPCLEHIFMVPKVFDPLKFYCIHCNFPFSLKLNSFAVIYSYTYVSMFTRTQQEFADTQKRTKITVYSSVLLLLTSVFQHLLIIVSS